MTQDMFNAWLPEQFKEHPDFPGIWVGNQGTILTTRKGRRFMDPYGAELRLVPTRDTRGYLACTYSLVHRLVAQVWIPNPDNLPEVNHKDEDKTNNTVVLNDDLSVNLELSNLEWCSHEYNQNYGTINARISATMKIAMKGNQNAKGKRSTETRAKISKALKGNQHGKGNKGNQNAKGSKSTTGYHWYTDSLTGERYYAKSPRTSEN